MIIEYEDRRLKYEFKNISVQISEKGVVRKYPCIGLFRRGEDVAIIYPGFERWYVDNDCIQSPSTLKKKASVIVQFLNFLLWNTRIRTLNEVSVSDVAAFYEHFKMTTYMTKRDIHEWGRGREFAVSFLMKYKEDCAEGVNWRVQQEFLYKETRFYSSKTNGLVEVKRLKNLRVSTGGKGEDYRMKNRYIPKDLKAIIIELARIHDPMIAFPIALQCDAGLREGEVVNLTKSSIKLISGGFGTIGGIEINLRHDACFATNYKGRTDFGHIKIYRSQKVYTKFNDEIYRLYRDHEALLDRVGITRSKEEALFLNHWNKPMTVFCYTDRVKKLFQRHLLPFLEKMCVDDDSWVEYAPFLEAWAPHYDSQKGMEVAAEYPGAHMFRHWFTMFLLWDQGLSKEEVARWRGDHNSESLWDYFHIDRRLEENYRRVVSRFQERMLYEIRQRERGIWTGRDN